MPWPSSRSRRPISAPAAVPDPQALRRAALQASWRRDRQVARLRLARRWLVWACWRYLLPVALVLAAALLAWLWLLPGLHALLHPEAAARPLQSVAAAAANPLLDVKAPPRRPALALTAPTSAPKFPHESENRLHSKES